jgi:hypothetical protein
VPLTSRSRSRSYFTTDSQPANMSWYRVPLWDLRPDIISCRIVAVWNLLSCIYWAPSLTRGRVCNLQCNHSIVRAAQNPKPYFTVSSETPPTWKARLPHLHPPRTGRPSYTPGHWVPFRSSFTTRRATVEVLQPSPPPGGKGPRTSIYSVELVSMTPLDCRIIFQLVRRTTITESKVIV